ncbi:ABC transporter permease [Nonomuraea roseoviolacea subsp. roseoviolacea]|uniref:Osmoprotectant transport system permease protein n=1 Tax=Nonomuraea roseoviolacea subsp. carminata TaxID=160689 RepID=A0ABT1K7M8_9ACTN|nr:ABC transporter permease [Nonomuraea roseoviolacea]MCP2349024.1 osmoprotectant transport system permease protein [Nonomuraea roseoviolacea subsp. carminata]
MDFSRYLERRWDDLLEQAVQHAAVVALSVLLATAIGVLVGVLTWRSARASGAAISVSAALLTIPSLALLALLIPLLGLGWAPTVVALVVYSLLPIIRNTVAGLRGVDPAILESARGMGLTGRQTMWRIQLPLAWPIILTGVRVSTQMLFAIATIAAYVAGPGLGNEILSGLAGLGSANALNKAVAGTAGVVLLALAFDLAFVGLRRVTTPRGLRV